MAVGQRFPQFRNRLVGRSPSDYAQEVQEYLYDVWRYTQGTPGGFLDTAATAIRAGIAAAAGSVLTSWAAADHVHSVETAAPANPTGKTASEGTGTALMRADAVVPDIILTTAALQPDGYALLSDSSQALGVRWAPGLSASEITYVQNQFVTNIDAGERSARTAMECDDRFASDRRSNPIPCDSVSCERGAR